MPTALTNYGTVPADKQAELIRGLEMKQTEDGRARDRLAVMLAETVQRYHAGSKLAGLRTGWFRKGRVHF